MKRQFILYTVIGSLSALLDVAVLQVLVLYSIDYRIATTTGFIIGFIFNYFCHQNITFSSRLSFRSAFRYAVIVGINYMFTLGLVMATVNLWGTPLPGKIVALPIVALSGYFFGRSWVFR